ncbi:ABC transporter permease [Fluoribacter dumoffii]|uniref:Inner membrane transport permease ybhR n=1 Tax=Fluoribacter dumoffii TaxID=463 RepID=A0A377GCU5_9GAMM|nr:ABC transporter permease [Fluoribacter dumoffii]KTC90800.1 ABC transporter permease [Fluoribacter dumoffii NY 23]MCW8386643.1 ABC transporter permease [Fluoribacter dumoffii]MCW8419697.1 ABC transporter permease [Fluoribacter dumoffii]MCW8455600.1 ABC transporter permease [Fluoribacter dumoffii]MCW8460321.1 ABC transporter permease [Fluoribacter dumoffii]
MTKTEFLRIWSIAKKEFIQIKRDFLIFLWLIFIPVIQILLFGYIINTDPKHLPTVVITTENTSFTRSLLEGLKNTNYFSIETVTQNEKTAERLLLSGRVLFVINIPPNFTRDLIRGKTPHVLIEADASDPVAVANAFRAVSELPAKVFEHQLQGSLNYLSPTQPPFVFDIHAKYNPEYISQFNTIPGLIALLIFSTLAVLTAVSINSEVERGTFETLLITPLTPANIILGKVIPYFIFGYVLLFILLAIAYFIFSIPFQGSLFLYLLLVAPYSLSSLGTGLAISAVTKTQFAALGLFNAYLIIATIISGFLFPFSGIPYWAQYISQLLPLTHFVRVTRNSMLKGAGWDILWPDMWPIIIFTLIIILLGVLLFRRTLD